MSGEGPAFFFQDIVGLIVGNKLRVTATMYEAVNNFGMKYDIWVKYPLSLFTIITIGNITYT